MSDLDQRAIEKALRHFFWDGKLSTSMFNVYDEAGRKEAARYFAKEVVKAAHSVTEQA